MAWHSSMLEHLSDDDDADFLGGGAFPLTKASAAGTGSILVVAKVEKNKREAFWSANLLSNSTENDVLSSFPSFWIALQLTVEQT
jgi:hypothetical protein